MAELLNSGIWHLIGIGGIGVSGVARLLHARGLQVQGSDVRESQLTLGLRALGIPAEGLLEACEAGEIDLLLTVKAEPLRGPGGNRWKAALENVGTVIALGTHAGPVVQRAAVAQAQLRQRGRRGGLRLQIHVAKLHRNRYIVDRARHQQPRVRDLG